VRELGIQIARALAAAHAANIVHRDVKPANILLAGNGAWKLADFGIARLPDSTLTAEGQFLGSPAYAAPESLGAGRFSPASDVYGLGATLYEALTGVPPHGDHDLRALVRKLDHDPPPIHTRRAVSAPLERAVMAALACDPERRPSADELARLLAITEVETQPVPQEPSARTKALAIVLAAVAIVLVVIATTRDPRGAGPTLESVATSPARPAPNAKPRPSARADEPRAARDDPSARAAEPAAPLEPSQPQSQIVDRYGNPVDDETARQILEQMERDARSEYGGIGKRRGRHRWR
jgi:serine/threonine-protein kinase